MVASKVWSFCAISFLLAATPLFALDLRASFIDAEDGYFDLSGLLAWGGFIPVPVIITEPAVKGGLGVAGQTDVHESRRDGLRRRADP